MNVSQNCIEQITDIVGQRSRICKIDVSRANTLIKDGNLLGTDTNTLICNEKRKKNNIMTFSRLPSNKKINDIKYFI